MGCNNDYCEIERTVEKPKPEGYPTKRDLDGCYFRVERDGKWENICFSDLTKAERSKVMSDKSAPWLISMCEYLAARLRNIGDLFDIECRG